MGLRVTAAWVSSAWTSACTPPFTFMPVNFGTVVTVTPLFLDMQNILHTRPRKRARRLTVGCNFVD